MNTEAAVKSAAHVLATQLPQSVLSSLILSGYPHITTTAPPAWFTGLPKKVKQNLVSQQSVLESVQASVLKITSAPAPEGARPTGFMAAAGAMGAVVGAAMFL